MDFQRLIVIPINFICIKFIKMLDLCVNNDEVCPTERKEVFYR